MADTSRLKSGRRRGIIEGGIETIIYQQFCEKKKINARISGEELEGPTWWKRKKHII